MEFAYEKLIFDKKDKDLNEFTYFLTKEVIDSYTHNNIKGFVDLNIPLNQDFLNKQNLFQNYKKEALENIYLLDYLNKNCKDLNFDYQDVLAEIVNSFNYPIAKYLKSNNLFDFNTSIKVFDSNFNSFLSQLGWKERMFKDLDKDKEYTFLEVLGNCHSYATANAFETLYKVGAKFNYDNLNDDFKNIVNQYENSFSLKASEENNLKTLIQNVNVI